jgi:hypothetical protein
VFIEHVCFMNYRLTRVRDRRPHLRQPDLVQRAGEHVQRGARRRQPVAQRLVVLAGLGEQPRVALLQVLRRLGIGFRARFPGGRAVLNSLTFRV